MKNMMKLLLCLLLVICMALSMVACGSGEDKDDKDKKDEASQSESQKADDKSEGNEDEDKSEGNEDETPTVDEDPTEDETPTEDEEPVVSDGSLEGYYSCVALLPQASVEEVVVSMIEAMECYDIEVSDLSNVDDLAFGLCYYVDVTEDTMDFTYDYESTQAVFDNFRDGLYDIMWEALELEAESYGASWDDMEQACEDEFSMSVDEYITTLIDSFETGLSLESQEDQTSSYTAADGIIEIDGEELEYVLDGDELYISYEGELCFYMVKE